MLNGVMGWVSSSFLIFFSSKGSSLSKKNYEGTYKSFIKLIDLLFELILLPS